MPSLKDLRNRISSVKSTQKITKAMQMVAASKLRRAQEAAEEARPYAERMDRVLANLGTRVTDPENAPELLVGNGRDDVHLLVVATASRGLCGGFNTNIARLARQRARELMTGGKTVKILCVGRKGRDNLRRDLGDKIIDLIDMREVKRVSFSDANEIGSRILKMYNDGEFDVCTLFYARFKNVLTQDPTALQLIPASIPEIEDEEDEAEDAGPQAAYTYEPEEEEILDALLPLNVSTQIFRALLENAAGEEGARMSAMDNATRNAGDMIDDLSLTYNRERQATITNELIEIVSGAEAL